MSANDVRMVSWDVDGTLYRLRPVRWHLAWMLARETVRGRGREARAEVAALGRRTELVERARSAGGVLDPELRAMCIDDQLLAIERRWLGAAIARVGPRAGVVEMLDHLAARRIPAVAISDYTAVYKLDALGLRNRFASVYEGVRVGCVKPSPELFERAAAEFGVPTSSLLHIGDRLDTDGVAARAAGCQVRILGHDLRSIQDLIAAIPGDNYPIQRGGS